MQEALYRYVTGVSIENSRLETPLHVHLINEASSTSIMLRIKSLKKSYKTQTQEDENDSDDNDGFVIRLQSFS